MINFKMEKIILLMEKENLHYLEVKNLTSDFKQDLNSSQTLLVIFFILA